MAVLALFASIVGLLEFIFKYLSMFQLLHLLLTGQLMLNGSSELAFFSRHGRLRGCRRVIGVYSFFNFFSKDMHMYCISPVYGIVF